MKQLAKMIGSYIVIMVFGGAVATAQTPRHRVGSEVRAIQQDNIFIGGRIGVVNVQGLGGAVIGFGGYGDYALADNVLVGGTLDFWNYKSGALGRQTVSVRDLALGGNAKLVFTNIKAPFKPYALVGATIHRFTLREAASRRRDDVVSIERYEDEKVDTKNELGFDIGGGAMYHLQEVVDLIGEIRYRSLVNEKVDLAHFAVTGGVSYKM